jgi:hypothetical protein
MRELCQSLAETHYFAPDRYRTLKVVRESKLRCLEQNMSGTTQQACSDKCTLEARILITLRIC